MSRVPARALTLILLLAAIPASAAAAGLQRVAIPRERGPSEWLELGMPRAARSAFLALPPAARAASPLLPRLMRQLADVGRPDEALALLEDVRTLLWEPVRSEAHFAAGMILWERKDHGKALAALRQVSPTARSGPEAAGYIARILAARGDAGDAARALLAAPPGGKKSLLAGEIEMLRGNRRAAAAAWDNAPSDGPAGLTAMRLLRATRADREPVGTGDDFRRPFRDRVADLETAAQRRLGDGNRADALRAATEALSILAGWERSAAVPTEWDGSREAADNAWKAMIVLFPYGEDAGGFLSSGRSLLAWTTLHGTLAAASRENRETAARVEAARDAVRRRRAEESALLGRLEEIRQRFRNGAEKTGAMRNRLRNAAGSLSLSAWGDAADPATSALLRAIDEKAARLRNRLERAGAAAETWTGETGANARTSEELRVLFFAKERLARADDDLYALEGRAALARGKAWNRWKALYTARLSRIARDAGTASGTADNGARHAEALARMLHADLAGLDAWEQQLARAKRTLEGEAGEVAGLLSAAREEARRSRDAARDALSRAIARKKRGLHYLAARAATEWRIEERGSASDNEVLPAARRNELLALAVGHWEASLPPPGAAASAVDESLYALGELRFEQEQARFLENEASGAPPVYEASAALFRRVLVEYPRSPYAEPAAYALALCHQEAGEAEKAVDVLERLLAQYPRTRFAPEIHLRLGEYAFDEHEFRRAEESYRKVGETASPEIRTTALYKLGWSLFLQGRPREAVEPFLSALQLSPAARRTGGLRDESLRMAARALVEANADPEVEEIIARRGATAHGPGVLLRMMEIMDAQNRYDDAVRIADRLGSSYALSAERVDAEVLAARALSKAHKDDDSHVRRGRFVSIFGPGSAWRSAPGREPSAAARADGIAEEELRNAAFYFHRKSRAGAPENRPAALSLYDAHMTAFPSAPKAEEIAYQRAWLLFEDGKKKDAGPAFEAAARLPGGARREASLYMAVQCAKDVATPTDRDANAAVARLCLAYARTFPAGDRLALVELDRARALFNMKDFPDAADAAALAAAHPASGPADRRAALRLLGEARFETRDYAGAETAFREGLAARPDAAEAAELGKWIGFSMFRRAEGVPKERAAVAGDLFSRVAQEFPGLEIATLALFRAGISFADAGKNPEAVAALLRVEGNERGNLATDATRLLARLYEKDGMFLPAAERTERLGGLAESPDEGRALIIKAAELFARGKDEARGRRNFLAAAAFPGTPPKSRIYCLYRAAESLRAEGSEKESDALYEEIGSAHRAAPDAAPDLAGKAYLRRAEYRFRTFAPMTIGEPAEKSYLDKQAALEACVPLYLEAVRTGDSETVAWALHRLGEGFENFRSAILASPPPPGLSREELEEYVFLLEEKAAPLEEKAVEAYQKNLRQAVASGYHSSWVAMSASRLKAVRPARYAKKWEYAFPVMTVPDFRGIVERGAP